MTHNQILDETLKSILKYIDPNEYPEVKNIIKLILENLILSAKLELMREINEGK